MAPKPVIRKKHPSDLQNVGGEPPWHRLPGEPEEAYGAFGSYLGLPIAERSFRAVAHIHNCDVDLIEAWSDEWHWVERSADHAISLRDSAGNDLVTLQRMVAERQRDVAGRLFDIIKKKADWMGEQPMDMVKPRDIAMLSGAFSVVARQDRISVGLPADSVRPPAGAGTTQIAVVLDPKMADSMNRFGGTVLNEVTAGTEDED